MTWKDEIGEIIQKTWSVGQVFTLDGLYQCVDALPKKHPDNSNIPEKIRQTLQFLRDEGMIEFVDNKGSYKRLA